MTVVAQSSVAQKTIRPNVFRPTCFSPNRLHPDRHTLNIPVLLRSGRPNFVSATACNILWVLPYIHDSIEQQATAEQLAIMHAVHWLNIIWLVLVLVLVKLTHWCSLLPYGYSYKHPMPGRVKPSFVIFDIRTLWRSRMSVRVSGCRKLQKTA